MAARIRAHDWAATPLGPVEAWPPALKVAVQLVLAQSYATNVCVGPSRTLIYNDAYARMIGAKHPGALGQDVREAFAEVRFASTLARAFAGETVALVDQPYPFRRHAEVELAWFDISYSPLRDERGKVFAAFVLHKETTDRVLAERALRESEARQTFLLRLSDALRPLADPVAVQGTAARLLGERLRASRAYYYEFKEDTATGRVHGEHPPGERASLVGTDAAAGWPTVHAAMRAGESLALPDAANSPRLTQAERASFGDLGFRALACVPLVKAGRLVAVLNVARATPGDWASDEVALIEETAERTWAAVERGRTEAALRESEERFRGFAAASSDVLWIRDAATLRMEYVSPAFAAVYGAAPERVLAGNTVRAWAGLIHPEDRKSALGGIRRVRRGERVIHEFRVRRPSDGALRWIRNTDFPLLEGQGRVRRVGGIGQDVTAEKRAEAALRALNAELERRVEERTGELMAAEATLRQAQKMDAVGQLTGGIAHDFNNMLQGIGANLELARRRAEQGRPTEATRHVEAARETVRRAAALTHRLLAFSRQQALDPALVRLDELVTGMAELIQRTVGPQVQLQVRLGDGAWPVLCDESRLENALLNLCVNARDAMPEGGWLTITTGEAELSAADLAGEEGLSPGAYAFVAVADTGAGMDEATRARVFEPFFTTKPIGHGTGLGLSQVYGFVRQSGGLVRLDSAPGQGTTVRLLLPRHSGDGAPDSPRTAGVVLLVEDEEDLRAAAAAWLREAGYRVLEAPDAATAQRLLHGGSRVDALVTDVGLPGSTNGRQLAGVARAQRPDLPVLFMTGYAGGELRGAALPPGMAVIDKPFSLDDLAARVRAMLSAAPDPWRLVPP